MKRLLLPISLWFLLFYPFIISAQSLNDQNLNYKSDYQIHKELLELSVKKSIEIISNDVPGFAVQQPIITTNPVRAKIGNKEGIKVDDLYKVCESDSNEKTGIITERIIGYVRVKKVADNNYSANGNSKPSVFYKNPCGNIQRGMKLQEMKQKNFSLGATFNTNNQSLVGGIFANMEYITHWYPGLRVGLDVGFNPSLSSSSVDYYKNDNFSGHAFTGSIFFKESVPFNFISVSPLFGFYYTNAALTSSSFNVSDPQEVYSGLKTIDLGFLYGIDVGFNVKNTLQIHAGFKKLLGTASTSNDNGYFPYQINFENSSFSIGARFYSF